MQGALKPGTAGRDCDVPSSLSVLLIIGTCVLGLLALLGVTHRRLRRREEVLVKLEAEVRRRALTTRVPSPAVPGPPSDGSGEAIRMVVLFTDMVKRLSAAQSAEEVPGVLVRTVAELVGTPSVAHFEYLGGEKTLRLTEGRGIPPGLVGALSFPLGQGKIGYAAQRGVVMEESDFEWEPPAERQAIHALPSAGAPTAICAPMVHQGRLFGILTLDAPAHRSPHLKNLLSAVADLAAIALHNAHLMGRFAQRAETDGLTGLFSRRAFAVRLAEEITRCRNFGDHVSLLMLDVDHFKHYNDTNGHPAGDVVLRRVADLLRQSFRKTDMVARYGGEEFAVIIPGLRKDHATILADRLRARIEGTDFPHGAGQPLGRVTVSAGVASFPQDTTTGDDLVHSADQALYEAKRAGRNRVLEYRPPELSAEALAPDETGHTGRTAALEEFLADLEESAERAEPDTSGTPSPAEASAPLSAVPPGGGPYQPSPH